ncbi:MAG: 50S ribosomal protein L11 methyltransferase [Chlamydiota bacterium]|nr:50S ribosomal protein L11 methyltransferase [Chlamydiota bacterium]
MEYISLTLKVGTSEEEAVTRLHEFGAEVLFTSYNEITDVLEIAILYSGDIEELHRENPFIDLIGYKIYEDVDWNEQWELHCEGYEKGLVEFDLNKYTDQDCSVTVKMQPGPGFGDLSHPTTRLVLQMMGKYVYGRSVLDIGCGSGVLTLSALALGANSVIGIDIDERAIAHASENLKLNHFSKKSLFGTVDTLGSSILEQGECLILMNMIRSEQQVAWDSVKEYLDFNYEVFTSGVQSTEREEYLEQVDTWGWILLDEVEEDGWLGFRFTRR